MYEYRNKLAAISEMTTLCGAVKVSIVLGAVHSLMFNNVNAAKLMPINSYSRVTRAAPSKINPTPWTLTLFARTLNPQSN
jgi:hypothetical protein